MAITAMNDASVVAGELEKVRQMGAFSIFYERDDVFLTKIEKRTDIEIVSNRAARIPIQMGPGGVAKQGSADGAGMGRGSGTSYKVMQISTLFFQLAVEITLLAQWATDSDAKARFNAMKREVQNGTKQFRTFLDRLAHTTGTGILATVTANPTTTTLTVDNAQLITPGMRVTLYASGQATQRTGTNTEVNVTTVDYNNNYVTVDGAWSDGQNTDVMCVGGLLGASPVSLNGIGYYLNNNTATSVLGLSRNTYPQLVTPTIAAGSVLTPSHPRQLLTRVRQALGVATPTKGGFFLGHPNQAAAWEEISVITQSTNQGGKVPDPLYDIEAGITMANRPFVEDLNQGKGRIDYIIPQAWGRTVVKDVDLVKIGDSTVFPSYGSDGSPNSSFIWYLGTQFNLFCENPRAGGSITGLATPTGYV